MGGCQVVLISEDPTAHPVLRIKNARAQIGGISEEYLVPFVDEIVRRVNTHARVLAIAPPPGLLELGRHRVLLENIKPELQARTQRLSCLL